MRKFESCLTCNEISFKAAWLKKEPHLAECDFKSQELFQSYIVSVFLTGKYMGQVMMDNCITSASLSETVMAPCSFTKMELYARTQAVWMVLKRVMKLGQEFLWFWNESKIHSEEAIVALSSSSATWKKIWMGGRVFHTRTIRRVSTSCLAGVGNFFQWNNVNYGVKGKTAVVMPSPCDPQKWFHCETTVSSKWVASLSKGLRLNFSLVLLKWNFQRSGNFWLT